MRVRRGVKLGIIVLGLGLVTGYAANGIAQSATTAPAAVPATTSTSIPAPATSAATTGGAAAVPLAPASSPSPSAPAATPNAAAAPADAAHATDDSQAELNAVEASISISKDRADQLRHEIDEMSGDRAKQNAALIAAGQRVKLAEIEVGAMEERLTALADAEKEVHGRLDGADSSISNMLAALERISLNPPPALIVDPSDALGSARSAILIAAIVPQLRAKADAVVADLKHLSDIKAEAVKEQDALKANFSVLEEEQLRIATLIEARRQGVAIAGAELDAEQKQAEELGVKATSLKQLVAQLTTKVAAVTAAASAADTPTPELPSSTPEAVKVALANTSRTQPAIPFASARGYLTLPAVGTDVLSYGAGDGYGGIAAGESLTTRPGAQVVAPADGWVMYKGPYLNYGQIVILNPGQDYTILLAGLDATSVDIGQFVLMGTPLGTMGSHTSGRPVTTSAGVSQPTLYIELRKNDQPVDPAGWWAPQSNTTQSG
jgi:septal ring factor EnvC (AmiA/AmiB activator)